MPHRRGGSRWALAALLAAMACGAQAPGPGLTPDQARARELFARAIGFRTSVGLGQVPVMANYLAAEFRAAGFPDADIHIFPLGETASMVVRYRGDGSGGKPILLMAHTDVVTAKPAEWRSDPFTLVEERGFFYGRGTIDVKDGLVCQMATLLRLKAEGFVPKRDLILLLTGDEETAQDTTADIVNNHRDLVDAEFALNTDAGNGTLDEGTGLPLFFSIGTAEKGYADYEVTVRNAGGHSSEPRADNAIYELADALRKVQVHAFPVTWNETTLAYFAGIGRLTPGTLGRAMRNFAANPRDQAAAALLAANPKYVGMTRTTCVPTLLRGGSAENALPEYATATINCRLFPGVDPVAVKATLQQLVGPGAAVAIVGTPFRTNASPLREDVLSAVTRALHARNPGVPVMPMQESGLSDAVFTRAIGIPTYGVGAAFIKDADNHMHGSNEGLPVKSFYDYLDFWYLLLKDLASRHA
jgi:acetylornithine deacetylase/succinyl-diaminopimelate desuccinylase-like protein